MRTNRTDGHVPSTRPSIRPVVSIGVGAGGGGGGGGAGIGGVVGGGLVGGGGGGAGDGDGDGAGAGVGGGGAGDGVAGALCCRSVTRSAPIVTLTARSTPAFGAAWTSITPSPWPDAGFRVSHCASDAAVHSQALCVRTSMPDLPPDDGNMPDGTEIVYRHAAACCETSACCSAMLIIALRTTGSAFAFTLYAMAPSPCPVCPETISTHDAEAAAVQLHSRATEILISPVPPDELKLGTELVMAAWQRVAVGPVTLVTALLPHPAISAAPIANRRGRTRVFTDEPNTSPAPAAVAA